jgi:hypothetical protein
MRLLFLFGSLLVAATTVAQTQKASDVADFVSVDTSVFVLDLCSARIPSDNSKSLKSRAVEPTRPHGRRLVVSAFM